MGFGYKNVSGQTSQINRLHNFYEDRDKKFNTYFGQ